MPITARRCASPSREVTNAPQSPPCAREALVAEHVGHQLGEDIGDLLDAEALLPRRERQPVARQRRRDHGEGIGRIAAEARRVGQPRDQLEELEHRARPAVREQQRHRHPAPCPARAGSAGRCRASGTLNWRKRVEPRLLRAPVEAARASSRRARAGSRALVPVAHGSPGGSSGQRTRAPGAGGGARDCPRRERERARVSLAFRIRPRARRPSPRTGLRPSRSRGRSCASRSTRTTPRTPAWCRARTRCVRRDPSGGCRPGRGSARGTPSGSGGCVRSGRRSMSRCARRSARKNLRMSSGSGLPVIIVAIMNVVSMILRNPSCSGKWYGPLKSDTAEICGRSRAPSGGTVDRRRTRA